jgi:hypothetical protein
MGQLSGSVKNLNIRYILTLLRSIQETEVSISPLNYSPPINNVAGYTENISVTVETDHDSL